MGLMTDKAKQNEAERARKHATTTRSVTVDSDGQEIVTITEVPETTGGGMLRRFRVGCLGSFAVMVLIIAAIIVAGIVAA